MKIGARIVKTGIAVTITMFICRLFNLEPAFFGAVSAVINMQPSILLTLKTARDQIFVHILGVSAGLVFGYLFGGNPVSMGVITIVMIAIYIKLNLKSGISMGIVAAVFVLSSSQEQFLPHALNRTAVIFAGLTTAMIVNIVLWPPRYKRQFKQKLRENNEEVVSYFCRAVQEFVQLEYEEPDMNEAQKTRVHKLNKEVRSLKSLLKREGEVLLAGPSEHDEWVAKAEKLVDYNRALTEKADRIYAVVLERYERRLRFGVPPISNEFKEILDILQSGCITINRINEKLRFVVIEGITAEPEEISEEYWEKLTIAIEQWQSKLTGSYYVHGLMEASVTASEIKWASRQAKRLLYEIVQNIDEDKTNQ